MRMIDNINIIFDGEKVVVNRLREKWISDNSNILYQELREFEKTLKFKVDKFSQLIYHYYHNEIHLPTCENCNLENSRFIGFDTGYKDGCGRHCAILLSRPKSNASRKANTIQKYGVEHTTQLKSVKEKMKKTNIEKYGVDNASRSDVVKKKIKDTNNKRYGVDLPLQNKAIREKMKTDYHEVHGVDNPIKNPLVLDKIKKNNLEKYGVEWSITSSEVREKITKSQYDYNYTNLLSVYGNIPTVDILSYEDNIIKFNCKKCNEHFTITPNLLHQRYVKNNIDICLVCNPLNSSTSDAERKIVEFLNELGIFNIIEGSRKIIKPYELDIYLPDYKIAIEHNGVYYHSDMLKDKDYHVMKLNMCNNIGIELIQIWEDDWIIKKDLIKSIIKSRLGLVNNTIYARKCVIKTINSNDSKIFLNNNHVQGWSISKYRYGLYYDNELVSIMTFAKGRKNVNAKKEEYEIVRFCNRLDTNVVGGMTRLFKNFIRDVNPTKIISFSDNDLFTGKSYENLNMVFVSESPNFYWCDGRIRHNRWNFIKTKLIKQGFDGIKTGDTIMRDRGWYKCYSSGIKKFSYVVPILD